MKRAPGWVQTSRLRWQKFRPLSHFPQKSERDTIRQKGRTYEKSSSNNQTLFQCTSKSRKRPLHLNLNPWITKPFCLVLREAIKNSILSTSQNSTLQLSKNFHLNSTRLGSSLFAKLTESPSPFTFGHFLAEAFWSPKKWPHLLVYDPLINELIKFGDPKHEDLWLSHLNPEFKGAIRISQSRPPNWAFNPHPLPQVCLLWLAP